MARKCASSPHRSGSARRCWGRGWGRRWGWRWLGRSLARVHHPRLHLMPYDQDAFISYAHIDNEPITTGQKGWVTQFHATLQTMLSQRLGERARIWRDDKLDGDDVFADAIVEQFTKTAVLVSILSPRYLRSEWCTLGRRRRCTERAGPGFWRPGPAGVFEPHQPPGVVAGAKPAKAAQRRQHRRRHPHHRARGGHRPGHHGHAGHCQARRLPGLLRARPERGARTVGHRVAHARPPGAARRAPADDRRRPGADGARAAGPLRRGRAPGGAQRGAGARRAQRPVAGHGAERLRGTVLRTKQLAPHRLAAGGRER